MNAPQLHGLLAEFADADRLLAAAVRARGAGHGRALEAYSPFPIEGLEEALGVGDTDRVPLFTLLGALVGGLGTFALECYAAVLNYPLNVGGRPLLSWPAFLPPAIEMALLGAALGGVLAMLIGNGLPRLHHPLFAAAAFERVSMDRFFLLWRADRAGFEARTARAFLETLSPLSITEVPR